MERIFVTNSLRVKNSYRGTTISVFQLGRGKGEGKEYGKTCNLGLFVPDCCHKIFFNPKSVWGDESSQQFHHWQ